VVLVKGAFTSIVAPDGTTYFNSTGNPGMAKGGSGDVLTGILTGLLAQNYTAIESAVLGAYVHGLAGDLVVHEMGMYSVLATDLVEVLPRAFRHLMLQKKTQ
jgi:ADP-dependent NAD(P)H-hydrate dehydratase / NAD(P)H-hydrate epimerase